MATSKPSGKISVYQLNECTNLQIIAACDSRTQVGQRFGRLTVAGCEFLLNWNERNDRKRAVVVLCDCEKYKLITVSELFANNRRSCGCLRLEIAAARFSTHGKCGHPLYSVWRGMRKRCYMPSNQDFHSYGQRGIVVCDEWLNDFEKFYDWSLSNGWERGLTIDRINNDGNYEPSNCRWATDLVQSNNKSTNVYLTAFGEKKSAKQWSRDERCAVKYRLLRDRIKAGWSDVDAITKPVYHTLQETKAGA